MGKYALKSATCHLPSHISSKHLCTNLLELPGQHLLAGCEQEVHNGLDGSSHNGNRMAAAIFPISFSFPLRKTSVSH